MARITRVSYIYFSFSTPVLLKYLSDYINSYFVSFFFFQIAKDFVGAKDEHVYIFITNKTKRYSFELYRVLRWCLSHVFFVLLV